MINIFQIIKTIFQIIFTGKRNHPISWNRLRPRPICPTALLSWLGSHHLLWRGGLQQPVSEGFSDLKLQMVDGCVEESHYCNGREGSGMCTGLRGICRMGMGSPWSCFDVGGWKLGGHLFVSLFVTRFNPKTDDFGLFQANSQTLNSVCNFYEQIWADGCLFILWFNNFKIWWVGARTNMVILISDNTYTCNSLINCSIIVYKCQSRSQVH